jgi:voltage-gated potassium channel
MLFPARPRVASWYERLTLGRAIRSILLVATLLVCVAGAFERLVEPDVFTSLGLAYWWAITTVTTVGYGDVVPQDVAGRIVGSLLMLTGLALIPTLTGVIVSALVSKRAEAQREIDRRLYEEQSARLKRMEEQLARLAGPPEP